MEEITEEEFESNFDFYMDQVEKKKKEFIIRLSDGRAVAMIPALDELKDVWDNIVSKEKLSDDDTTESPA